MGILTLLKMKNAVIRAGDQMKVGTTSALILLSPVTVEATSRVKGQVVGTTTVGATRSSLVLPCGDISGTSDELNILLVGMKRSDAVSAPLL